MFLSLLDRKPLPCAAPSARSIEERMAENKLNLRWKQHPLISSVLWILGGDGMDAPDGQPGHANQTQKGNVVVWKDEQGGNINEYIAQIQLAEGKERPPRDSGEDSTQNGVQLFPRTFHAREYPSDVMEKSRLVPSDPRDENSDVVYESPQWGFYVPITPPQQEVFAALSKEVTHTVQEDQRKANKR